MSSAAHIKKAPHNDQEQTLLQKENISDSENCLNTMKKISGLIEAVSKLLETGFEGCFNKTLYACELRPMRRLKL